MKSRLYSFIKAFIGLPLTLLAFFFIARILIAQQSTLLAQLHTIHIFLLLYGIISFVIYYYLRSYTWHRLLKLFKYSLSFSESTYLWEMSEFKRYIPGNVWAFLGRTVMFKEKGIPKKDTARGMIIETELFVIGSIIVSLLSLPFFFSKHQSFLIWSIVFLVIASTIVYCLNGKIHATFSGRVKKVITYLFPSFSISEHGFLIWVSIITYFFYGLGNYFVINSVIYLNPHLFLQLIGLFNLAFVIGFLSVVAPSGFGVREGIVLFSLEKIMTSSLAAFGALFSRIVLIFSEIIFIATCLLWYKMHKKLNLIEEVIRKYPQVSILSFLVGVYILYFTIVSFLRYDNFYAGRFDLGNMVQTVWNTFHGKIFLFTNPNGTEPISRLAYHADFILVLLAPFFAIWESPNMLLLIQTLVIAAGAFFVYLIARDVVNNRNVALTFAFAFLLNPSLQRTNIYDFHAVTLATTFFLATYYFLLKKRYILFVLFAILAALCKEQLWLIVALFGLLVIFMHKKPVFGSLLFVAGVAMFYLLVWYAIPKTLGAQHFALAYFSEFGDSPTQVVKEIIFSPQQVFKTVTEHTRLEYLNQLFLPIGYLGVLFPFFLVFAGPDLLIDLLSNNAQLHQIYYQYTATITPFIFLCAIYAVFWIRAIKLPRLHLTPSRWDFLFIIYLLAASLWGAYLYGPLPGAYDPNLDMFTKQVPDRLFIDNYLQSIPKKNSVSASNALGSHLSLRDNIYTIPYGIGKADDVVLLFTDPQSKEEYPKLLKDPQYKEVVHKNNFVAFKKK